MRPSIALSVLILVIQGGCVTTRGFGDLDETERVGVCGGADRMPTILAPLAGSCAHGQQLVPSMGDIGSPTLSASAEVVVAEDGTISDVLEVRSMVAYDLTKALNECVASSLFGARVTAKLRARTRLMIFLELDPPGPLRVEGCDSTTKRGSP